ncbi:MAG: tetratricopeptide repeat protein [Myxococcota bacterium]|nr:tetratricopeptide repeat protein [Myxococcota bacterium]MDW8363079.1 tetratricopeptide repeat protein [Myxococcales bacterium]
MRGGDDNVIHVTFGRGGGRRRVPAAGGAAASNESRDAARPTGSAEGDPLAALYETNEVARLFGIPAGRLRAWARSGFIVPSVARGRRRHYTFQDLIAIRTARGLLERGVSVRAVRRAVDALRASLPRVTRPLSELRVVTDGRTVVVRGPGGAFEAETGQLVLDFDVGSLRDEVVRVLRRDDGGRRRQQAYTLYLEGCKLDEDAATLERAEELYREALRVDPTLACALTNLGNVRHRRGAPHEAEELYRQALRIDAAQPEAWYNLGYIAFERGQYEQAAAHFRTAIGHDPGFADAHFNLAMTLEELGRHREAVTHWRTYLRLEPRGPWADIARRHLGRDG